MSIEQKISSLEKLLKQKEEIARESASEASFRTWKNLVERTLVRIYGRDSLEMKQFLNLRFSYYGIVVGGVDYSSNHLKNYRRSMSILLQAIESYIEELNEELDEEVQTEIELVDNQVDRIFISHSSEDKEYVEELIELIESLGVDSNQIFCTSFGGYGIEFGENFLDRIKYELDNNVLVLFVLSGNFFNSAVCLCEMGATWMKTHRHIPILLPKFSFKEIQGVIPLTQGFKINEREALNQFKNQIEELMKVDSISNYSTWERKRDRIIERIENI